ncbi:methicillin resistance protein [Aliivibrio logei]|uniref:methicillin resistance protein n=1 Tax=Aliivibrio logei TaxID=688 RepID=UPI0035C8D17E
MLLKDKYRELCKLEESIPLFSQDWWLDSVCGKDNWDVCLVEKGRKVYASMPYYIHNKKGFRFITQPPLTQTLGPWIRHESTTESKKLENEKKLMNSLISQIPKVDYFNQQWNYKNTNWLPFYWQNYTQTTRYTYRIPNISDADEIISKFDAAKRKNIKKSENIVTIKKNITAKEFFDNHKMTLSLQESEISYSFETFKRIYDSAYERDSGMTIAAYDCDNNLHAALFIVWDSNSAYDLISTIDPRFRSSGAASLLIKEAIIILSGKTKAFDFEGSMIEPVERSFRQFGAEQTPYFMISKTNSKLLKIRNALKEILR